MSGVLFFSYFTQIEEHIAYQIYYTQIPFASQNKSFRQAEIYAASYYFDKADAFYKKGLRQTKNKKDILAVKRQISTYKAWYDATLSVNKGLKQWAIEDKRAAERRKNRDESNVKLGLFIQGMQTFNSTLNETNQIIHNSNMDMINAAQNAYTSKKLDQLIKNTNTSNPNTSAPNANTARFSVAQANSAYERQRQAINQWRSANGNLKALYNVKAGLNDVYTSPKGTAFKVDIDKRIAAATTEFNRANDLIERLSSIDQHIDALNQYIEAHPNDEKNVLYNFDYQRDELPFVNKWNNHYAYYHQNRKNYW